MFEQITVTLDRAEAEVLLRRGDADGWALGTAEGKLHNALNQTPSGEGEGEAPRTFSELRDRFVDPEKEELRAELQRFREECSHRDTTLNGDGTMTCDLCGATEPDPFAAAHPHDQEAPESPTRAAMREFMQTVRSSPDPKSDEIRATGAALSKLHEAIFSEQYSDDQEAPQVSSGDGEARGFQRERDRECDRANLLEEERDRAEDELTKLRASKPSTLTDEERERLTDIADFLASTPETTPHAQKTIALLRTLARKEQR